MMLTELFYDKLWCSRCPDKRLPNKCARTTPSQDNLAAGQSLPWNTRLPGKMFPLLVLCYVDVTGTTATYGQENCELSKVKYISLLCT